MKKKKILRVLLLLVILVAGLVFATDAWVSRSTRSQVYNDVAAIPHNKVGLLLGTAKTLKDGSVNLYYQYRINAAIALYKAGKVDFLLVSGDNGRVAYDETSAMQADLIAAGIPKEKIFMDYAGFRTLDSILRCKEVFGESRITVISQLFHNQRSLFIANHKGLTAVAFNAADVQISSGFRTQLREKFARVKMLLDLAFGKEAKFYGDKIPIG
ncbi:SanA/YdcF family protein [Taibaiella chishuiensis]|uniref:SanA protein n=1 Tax=Taibaiella chishuiensis TaxID=1434707 RepID=A0A2P8DAZ6_9BACT|nr:ElyC/SanA/YdcF family protein [Taibaiella chishuiensis]PSK94393.1 SanA protein [Taibaiella chishuiensis]